MARFNKLIAIIIATFCVLAFANQGEPNMESKQTLVISYDYPQERVVKESTAKLHQVTNTSYHGQGKFDLKILGEKGTIVIPDLSESFLNFNRKFLSAKVYLLPTSHWSKLGTSKNHIKEMRTKLKFLKDYALKYDEPDLEKLTPEFFKNENVELVGKYELEHYKIFFLINKLNTPHEIHPRDQDYFQLSIRIDNKNL